MRDGINIFEDDFWAINDTLNRLLQGTNARTILLIDKAGQLITSCGDTTSLDTSSFATLSAADFAATSQLAALIGEKEFSTLFHQGEKERNKQNARKIPMKPSPAVTTTSGTAIKNEPIFFQWL